ncbi:MAG: recombinase family protein, partial [Proteobacteria bacterium]|nr:recombinase family protein [Pseudomonadota bacterium]
PEYIKLLKKLHRGDLLYIKSIDRLGRNYKEIQEQWRFLTKEKGVDICILDMPLLDTRKDKDLTGILIADIVLQLLSYVAETERDMIRQRQKEGIKAAIARGIHLGRPKRELDESFFNALNAWKSGQMTCKQAAASCGMSLSNFRYHAEKV